MAIKHDIIVSANKVLQSFSSMKIYNWLQSNHKRPVITRHYSIIKHLQIKPATVWFSILHSWYLSGVVNQIKQAVDDVGEDNVSIGGPIFNWPSNKQFIIEQTGIHPKVGIDKRFDAQEGLYHYVQYIRGCSGYRKSCGLCMIPSIDGHEPKILPKDRLAKILPSEVLIDSNLTAIPLEHQEYIVKEYRTKYSPKSPAIQIGGGFDPQHITPETISIWERLPRFHNWLIGYDGLDEREYACKAIKMLSEWGYTRDTLQIACKIGHEPKEACLQRVKDIIELGGTPHIFINYSPDQREHGYFSDKAFKIEHDWDLDTLLAFRDFYHKSLGHGNPASFESHGKKLLRWIDWKPDLSKLREGIKYNSCGCDDWSHDYDPDLGSPCMSDIYKYSWMDETVSFLKTPYK